MFVSVGANVVVSRKKGVFPPIAIIYLLLFLCGYFGIWFRHFRGEMTWAVPVRLGLLAFRFLPPVSTGVLSIVIGRGLRFMFVPLYLGFPVLFSVSLALC